MILDYRQLVEQSLEELRLKIAAHDRLWHLGDADWSVDQDVGDIIFSAPDGIVATCPVQIIGTFDTNDSTWLWAWDHPSVQPSLRKHASRLREYGEVNSIPELTSRKLSVTEEQCWEFTALACKLNDAQGGYRGPSGSTLVFVTFGEPKLNAFVADHPPAVAAAAPEHSAGFTTDIPDDVRATLVGFITALYNWEVAAFEASEVNDSPEAIETATEDYNALIRRWCVPEVEPQPVSFGSNPDHHPEKERLISASSTEDLCRVRTQQTDSTGFVSDYEYRLRLIDGNWMVQSVLSVDEDGKYETL